MKQTYPKNTPTKLKTWDNCHHKEPDIKTYQYSDNTKYEICSICGISRKIV